jgi:mannose-1-phosphate guanylyltransferase
MITIADLQFSEELQELYLENKEYNAQLKFLQDEYRFFTKLLDAEQFDFKNKTEEQVILVEKSLTQLKEKLKKVEELAGQHKQLIESVLKNPKQPIDLTLIEMNATLGDSLKSLLQADREIKTELFTLVEGEKKWTNSNT